MRSGLLLALAHGTLAAAPVAPANSAWSVRVWQSDDGLPNNRVTGLAQTPDGYLWVGTYSSPARFDGVRFDEYSPRDFAGSVSHKISALELSQNGGLWIGALHSAVFLADMKTIRAFESGLTDKEVQTLTEDGQGALWITSRGGFLSRLKDGQLKVFGRDDGLPDSIRPDRYVCAIARDIHGRIWFSKDGRVGLFRREKLESLLHLGPLNTRICGASMGGIWLCFDGKLCHYAEGSPLQQKGVVPWNAGRTEPTVVFEDRDRGVWIGTSDNGLFHYDGTRIESVPTSDPEITRIIQDREGNVWVGTASGGLNRICPRVVSLETPDTGLPSAIVQSICEDSSGTIWITDQNGQLARRQGTSWEILSDKPNWPGGRASCVAADPSGPVWIATRDRALHRWKDGEYTTWRTKDGLVGREIHGLLVDRTGAVWIGGISPDCVQVLRNDRLENLPLPGRIRIVRAIAEDTRGDIWLGTSGGMLLRVRDGKVTDETGVVIGEPLSIRALHATPDGGLWIGFADEGLGWLKDGRFLHISSKLGFPENNVSQILSDAKEGWLWFAGDHGIYRVRQRDLEELAQGIQAKAHFSRYGLNEGLLSLEANRGDSPNAALTRDGRLWLPMRSGLAIVDPGRRRRVAEPPPVLLKRVEVDGHDVAAYGGLVPLRDALRLGPEAGAKNQLRLHPGHHRIAFEFTALSFDSPENLRFRYRLSGYDDRWIEAGNERAGSYSRLPSGDYEFEVQACNSDGIWNQKGVALAFSVSPFLWQTWWFRIVVLLGFTSLTAAIVRYASLHRVRKRVEALERQAALHKERTRIARDLHDEFGTRLTELGLIAELERKKSSAGEAPDPKRPDLVKHIRSLEQDLDAIVWAVNPKNDTVDHLVGFICRFAGEYLGRSAISCRFDLPDDLPTHALIPEVRHNLFMVVREAVNNVVKHSGATEAKLRVKTEGNRFEFCLEDNGRGFSVATAEASPRNGLKNMKARIEELGGTYHVQSSPGQGTVLQFSLPFSPVSPLPTPGALRPARSP